MDPRTAILGVVVPAVVAGAALLLQRRWAGGLALALAAIAGALVVFWGQLGSEVAPRLALVGVGAALVGAVPSTKVRLSLLALLAAAAPAVVLYAVPRETLNVHQKVGWGALEAVIIFAGAASLDLWAARTESIAAPITVWVLAAGGAGAVALAGYVSGGQLAGAVAAGLGALAVLSWFRPVPGRIQAAMAVAANVLPGVWLVGYYLSELPAWVGILLGLAPLAVWISELPKRFLAPVIMALVVSAGVAATVPNEMWAQLKAKVSGEKPAASAEGY
jgi:hypothetical protein